jgi:hypothetical protein
MQAPHEANPFDMNAKYADVVSEQETLACVGSAGRDDERDYPDTWRHRDRTERGHHDVE